MSLVVKHISKRYGQQLALEDLSFELKPGAIVGFLGPNGAGKSTTMHILSGYMQADSGELFLAGQRFTGTELNLKRKIGYLPESTPLYADMYVREYLMYVAELYALKGAKNRIEQVITQLGLTQESNKKISTLSKGYKQRVGLAQALLHDPDLLILDEATSGLDPNQLIEIRALIKEYAANKMVLISTHIMEEVEAICDELLIINKGKLIWSGSLQNLKESNPGDTLSDIFKRLTS